MITTISITSQSQGQIYGANPSLEEIERQLDADPMTRAGNRVVHRLAAIVPGLRRASLSAMKLKPITFDGVAANKPGAL